MFKYTIARTEVDVKENFERVHDKSKSCVCRALQ